jgi:hypothetical protein
LCATVINGEEILTQFINKISYILPPTVRNQSHALAFFSRAFDSYPLSPTSFQEIHRADLPEGREQDGCALSSLFSATSRFALLLLSSGAE